jgi:DNA polymerase-3 subunit delta
MGKPGIRKPRAGPAGAIHAVAGSDEGEIKRIAAEFATQLAPPGAGEFGTDIVDGAADTVDQALTAIRRTIEAILTLPFLGDGKLIWLKNASFFADTVAGRSGAVLEAIQELADLLTRGLPEGIVLLISAIGVDKRRSFYKTLTKIGNVKVLDRVDTGRSGWEEAAFDVVAQRASDKNLNLSQEAAQLLALLTGGDGRQVDNELEKLGVHDGGSGRPITADTVRALVPLSRSGVIFELGNAVAARDIPRAMALVRQLLDQGESAIGILLVALVPAARNLLIAKDLLDRHRIPSPSTPFAFTNALKRLPEAALAHLPRKKDGTVNTFALGLTAMHTHRFSLDEIESFFQACLHANVQLVTSQLEPEVVLCRVIASLGGPKKRRAVSER